VFVACDGDRLVDSVQYGKKINLVTDTSQCDNQQGEKVIFRHIQGLRLPIDELTISGGMTKARSPFRMLVEWQIRLMVLYVNSIVSLVSPLRL
jgi:hypothetical protein